MPIWVQIDKIKPSKPRLSSHSEKNSREWKYFPNVNGNWSSRYITITIEGKNKITFDWDIIIPQLEAGNNLIKRRLWDCDVDRSRWPSLRSPGLSGYNDNSVCDANPLNMSPRRPRHIDTHLYIIPRSQLGHRPHSPHIPTPTWLV